MLNVFILWHMHQPSYVNPSTGMAEMPWVRLHAVKGYLDMASILDEFPDVRVNFNLTPVLVKQILDFNEGRVKDAWFELSAKPAEALSPEEKILIIENFFKINWDNLIKPHARYYELLGRRGFSFDRDKAPMVIADFSEQDFRDLQTWFNLGWCGYRAEKLFPRLRDLKKKGGHFTEAEKHEVLNIHRQILRDILGIYRRLEEAGQIELTTTPFFHPILPLVYDTGFARRCMPGRSLPRRFNWPEDAQGQLFRAVEQHRQVFGRNPRGLWPSEGSVAPELIPLMRKAGIEYFCTDEAVLFRSLDADPAWTGQKPDHLELFQGWSAEHQGEKINAIFRERPLSDFIGFVASKNTPQQAASYLLHHIEHIASVAREPNALIALILDGENAWEHFPDGGEGFLRELYANLSRHKTLRTVRGSDYFAEFPQTRCTTTLHTGSWINSDFDIWIGDEKEENVAWNLLGQTRQFLQERLLEGSVSEEARERAFDAMYAAEGSDWFWWFGPDFHTDCDTLFDSLFRTHLQNVYRALGAEPAQNLFIPIRRPASKALILSPRRMAAPEIDGQISSLAEWEGSGMYLAGGEQGAMFRSDRLVKTIRYGYNSTHFFLGLDFHQKHDQDTEIRLDIIAPSFMRITLPLHGQHPRATFELSYDGKHYLKLETTCQASLGHILEVAIPLYCLPWKENDLVHFVVSALSNGIELERHPELDAIGFSFQP